MITKIPAAPPLSFSIYIYRNVMGKICAEQLGLYISLVLVIEGRGQLHCIVN
jgi:hypothetical protein